MNGYLTVVVKGKGIPVFNQLDARGIKAFMVETLERETVVWTGKDEIGRIVSWFCEIPELIPGYGFPDGTCLIYSHHGGDPKDRYEEEEENVCGVTGTQDHAPECKYLGNNAWDCSKLDNQGSC